LKYTPSMSLSLVEPAAAHLSGAAREFLLTRARDSIAYGLARTVLPEASQKPAGVDVPRGCFVSLHTPDGTLRGCLGTFDDGTPLIQNVEVMAIAAATRDPRFEPLEARELEGCVIEISALTARQAARKNEVRIGQHGLWIERGGRRGVLLPQVAVEHGWDVETFLQFTCKKAGLPPDAWHEPATQVAVFSAEVFTE
jgi:AmmeMemoRadiSam system protein A